MTSSPERAADEGAHPPTRVVFIAAVGHSGSTLLEMVLAARCGAVGIGEAFQLADPENPLLREAADRRCSCGAIADRCVVWGPILNTLNGLSSASAAERYRVIYDGFLAHYGPGAVLIDSSKTPRALATAATSGVDLRVIHLIRDVRGWLVSMQDNYSRHKAQFRLRALVRDRGVRGLVRYLRKNRFWAIHEWYRTNRMIGECVKNLGVPVVTTRYEDLCLRTAMFLAQTTRRLELSMDRVSSDLSDATVHSLAGNRMRFQADKLAGILYDDRWFSRADWVLPWLSHAPARRYLCQLGKEDSLMRVWEQ